MSTVAERIAAINAKKKETPPAVIPKPKPKPLEIKANGPDNSSGWLAQKPDAPGLRTYIAPVKKVGTAASTLTGIVSPKSQQQNVTAFPSPSSSPPPIRTASPQQEKATSKPILPILNSSSIKVVEKEIPTETSSLKEVKPASTENTKPVQVVEEEKKIKKEEEEPIKSVVVIPVKSMEDSPKVENKQEEKATMQETTSKVEQAVEANESKLNENSEAKKTEEIEETKVPERTPIKQEEESKHDESVPPPIPASREEVPETAENESEVNEVVDRREASGSLVLLEEDVVPLPTTPATTEKRVSTVTFETEVIEHEIPSKEDEQVENNTKEEETVSSPPTKPAITFVDIDEIPPPPPPPPKLETTRTNSVRFGIADEVAVHEYDYDEFDNKSDAGNSSTGAPPRRRSSLSQKVVSILKRASSRSLRKKNNIDEDNDEDDRRNGVHWG